MRRPVDNHAYAMLRSRLVEARRSTGISQSETAMRLGKPQSFVSKYERGERRLDVVEFLAVSDALGIDPFKLLRELRNHDVVAQRVTM